MFKNITKADIIFKTENISILKPHIKKGILIFHSIYNEDENAVSDIKKEGLKSGFQLNKEGINFGREIYHKNIFFKAPWIKPININYNCVNAELCDIYPDLFDSQHILQKMHNRVIIRVDPNETFVYSSEIRVNYHGEEMNKLLKQSKMSLTDYFNIISTNPLPIYCKHTTPMWHLITRKLCYFSSEHFVSNIFSKYPIERNSEILLDTNVLKPDYFVSVI